MKRFINLSLILVLISFLTTTAFASDIVELHLPKSNKVVIKLMFKNGSINDPKGKEGLTYATGQLVAGGGIGGDFAMSYSEIQDKIYPMASGYNVSIDKEVTIFTFSVHKDFLEEFYPIVKGLILNPAFEQKDFKRLMDGQQNFVDQVIRASSDEEYSKKSLEDFLFRGTNYQHLKQGKSASVKSITLDDIKSHYSQRFTTGNLTIGIAGNYSAGFLKQLKHDMRSLPTNKMAEAAAGKARTPNGIEVEIVAKKNAFGSAIFTGYPLEITRSSDDFAALMVANSWLGEHRKGYSRLYQKIREQRSMNYGDYSYIEWYENGGRNMLPQAGVPRSSNYMSMWIRPVQIAKQLKQQYEELAEIKLGHAHYALRMVVRELDLLIENGMSQADFEATRDFLRSYTKLYAQTPNARLGYLMDSKFYGRQDFLAEADSLMEKLTLDDVNNAIKKYFQVENMFVTIVTDESEVEALKESLINNTVSPMSYSNALKKGLAQSILDEDELVAKYPLNIKSVKIVKSGDTFQ
jgi:zinc protease